MTNETNVAAGDGEADTYAIVTPDGDGPLTVRNAGRALASFRLARENTQNDDRDDNDETAMTDRAPSEGVRAEPPNELAEGSDDPADAAPPHEEAPGETREAEPADDLPPIEPPRSWTSEEKERFKALPRELQAYLNEREQQRDREVRTRQNESAEQRKTLEAERTRAEQVRLHYESALPTLLQNLQLQQAGEFPDIRNLVDIERLAREDSSRYALWDAQQKRIAAVRGEVQAAQQRQAHEAGANWTDFTKRQDELFIEKVPEFADNDTAAKLRDTAMDVLNDIGFDEQELDRMWKGHSIMTLRDHRVQLLIRDAVRLREIEAKARQAAKKSVPHVQRPGVGRPHGAQAEAELQTLRQRLDKSGSLKDAAAFRALQQRMARRG